MRYRTFKMGLAAQAAALLHGRPSRRMRVVFVLGPDGAVGTAAFLASMLRAAGERVGVLTSQFVQIVGEQVKGSDQADLTGDPHRVQALLAQMRKAGCQYAIIEVPRELPEHQFKGVAMHMLIIRRCGDNYIDQTAVAAQSAKLAQLLARQPELIVYNRDDPAAEGLQALRGQHNAISFGTHQRADCQIGRVELHPKGTEVVLTIDHHTSLTMVTVLAGKQTVLNVTAAAAAAYVLQIPVTAIENGCYNQSQLPAQLEFVSIVRPYRLILDASATPEGIAEALEASKYFAKNRLIVVFGTSIGTLPHWLPQIGELLARFADRLVITDGEFPPTSSPKQLREAVGQGIQAAGGEAITNEIPDRRAAIEKAVGIARRGDVVLIAGSNIRPYRQLGEEHLPWSDAKIIQELFGL